MGTLLPAIPLAFALTVSAWGDPQIRSTYAVTMSTFARAQVVELKQPPSEFRSTFSGDLILIGRMRAEKLYGKVEVHNLALLNGSEHLPAEEGTLRAALQRPFLVLRKNGKITGCSFFSDVPPEGRKMVRTILSIAQLPAAAQASRSRLTLDDTIGTKLLQTRSARGSEILTEKKYFANVANPESLNLRGEWIVKPSSRNLLELDELRGQEALQSVVTKLSRSTTRIQASIRHTVTAPAPKASWQLGSVQFERLWARPTEAEVQKSLALHTLHGLDSATVFRIVDSLGTKNQSDQSGTDAFSKLRALVIVSDSSTREVGRRLKVAPVATPQFAVYGQALIGAGTPLAQTIFLEALRFRQDQTVASMRLIAELVGLDHPTGSTIYALRELSVDGSHAVIASSSVLILGRFASRIKSSSPSESASLISGLGSSLLSAKDASRQRLLIGALGNAGQASCLPYLQRFVDSSDPRVRADAISALRFIPSGKVDDLLCNRLLHDRSDEVREAAVFALSFRPHGDRNFGSLVLSLREDPSERVRRSALNALWAQRESQPAIVMIVSEVAKKDRSKDIRKTATDLLNIDRAKG